MNTNIFFLCLCLLSLTACKNDKASAAPAKLEAQVEAVQPTEAAPTEEAEVVKTVKPSPAPAPASVKKEQKTYAKFSFLEKDYQFGMVDEGKIIKHDFRFINEGKVPLLIRNAETTCGCTVPEWPKEPIPPGGAGVISVTFDTKGKLGSQKKEVTIFANTSPSKTKVALVGVVGTFSKKKEKVQEVKEMVQDSL